MPLNITAPFGRQGAFPIDEKFEMTKAQMLAVNDNVMPDNYFCVCKDDKQFYLYNKQNDMDPETGKYRVFKSSKDVEVIEYGDSESYSRIWSIYQANSGSLENCILKVPDAFGYFYTYHQIVSVDGPDPTGSMVFGAPITMTVNKSVATIPFNAGYLGNTTTVGFECFRSDGTRSPYTGFRIVAQHDGGEQAYLRIDPSTNELTWDTNYDIYTLASDVDGNIPKFTFPSFVAYDKFEGYYLTPVQNPLQNDLYCYTEPSAEDGVNAGIVRVYLNSFDSGVQDHFIKYVCEADAEQTHWYELEDNVYAELDSFLNLAPKYDPDHGVYEVGDVVVFITPNDNKAKLYKCIERHTPLKIPIEGSDPPVETPVSLYPTPSYWKEITVYELIEEGTSVDPIIGKAITTNIDVGGLKSGTAIAETDTLASIIERMVTTVYYPTYVAPSASLAYSASALAKVGSSIEAKAGTVSYDAGAIMLQGTKQADRGGAAVEYRLYSSGATTEFDETNATGSFNVSALTRATKGNITLVGTVSYGQGPQPVDSAGENYETPLAAGSVNTSAKTIEFILPFYRGVNAADTIADFTGFTEDLSKKGQKSYAYTAANQYCYICYDSAYGDLKSILDENNFENKDSWVKSTITVDGQSYNVYRSGFAITGSQTFTFKF